MVQAGANLLGNALTEATGMNIDLGSLLGSMDLGGLDLSGLGLGGGSSSDDSSSDNNDEENWDFICENMSYTPLASGDEAVIDDPAEQIRKDPSKKDDNNHLGGGDCIKHELDRFGTSIISLRFDA